MMQVEEAANVRLRGGRLVNMLEQEQRGQSACNRVRQDEQGDDHRGQAA